MTGATHIVTLSFDDGFVISCPKVAEIYEQRGLSACFNVVATGHTETRAKVAHPEYWAPKGDFMLWNELQARGHEIMPHGFTHADKSAIPLDCAQELIKACLAVFTEELAGFESGSAVFNFPYNRSTPELETWLTGMVRAFRTAGEPINALPHAGMARLTTTGEGPGNCEQHLDQQIERLLAQPTGWLLYNLHGIDEGWGPIRSEYLERLLDRLLAIETVRVLPAGRVLQSAVVTAAVG